MEEYVACVSHMSVSIIPCRLLNATYCNMKDNHARDGTCGLLRPPWARQDLPSRQLVFAAIAIGFCSKGRIGQSDE